MAYKSQITVKRPANTTAYTAGDVVGGAFQLAGMPGAQKDILITSAELRINIAAVPAGMTSFKLHLYNDAPRSEIADNAAWNLATADRPYYLGYVNMGTAVDETDTLYTQADQVNKQIRTGSTGLWAYIETDGGYTPAANSEDYVPCVYAVATD